METGLDLHTPQKGLLVIKEQPDNYKKWLAVHDGTDSLQGESEIVRRDWKKSRELGIDSKRALPRQLSQAEYSRIKKDHKRLMICSDWVINHLIENSDSEDLRVLLFSRDGVLLRIYGEPFENDWLADCGVRYGGNWSFEEIGVSVLSVGMESRRIFEFAGYKNYSSFLVNGAYYYAPIHYMENDLAASIVVAVPAKQRNAHLRAVVGAVARSIELDVFMLHSVERFTSSEEDQGSIFMSRDGEKYKITLITNQVFKILGIKKVDSYHLTLDELILPLPENKDFWNIITNGKSVTDKQLQLSVIGGRVNISMTTATYKKNNFHPDGYTIFLSPSQGVGKLPARVNDNNARYCFADVIGENELILETARRSQIAALSDSNILIQGESGVGKDVFAQSIHNASNRSHKPFVAINCAAFSKELIASELFGYESGAFTGAKREGNIGKFEIANHGTLFLDEIGDMPMEVQSVLLRALEEKTFRKVGGNELIKVDVRIIAATNKNLRELIEQKVFREDLFYRLSVIRINVPPLRNRGADIYQFAELFIKKLCNRMDKPLITLSKGAMDYIGRYPWPGNIRELQNMLEGIIGTHDETLITEKDISSYLGDYFAEIRYDEESPLIASDIYGIDEKERFQIALRKCRNNKTKAAEYLGMSRSTFYRRLEEFGMN